MSHNGNEAKGKAPTQRPRHQITRSITELSSPIRLHRHHHSQSQRSRGRDDKIPVPQSAAPILQGRHSLEGTRSEAYTPNLSPNPSRRTSVQLTSDDNATAATSLSAPSKRLTREEELILERDLAAARATGIQRSLADLGTFSTATARRLDVAYSSVLEKLGVLQGTTMALKELASLSQNMNDEFAHESQEVVGDVQTQLDAFKQFNDQQDRIQALQDRIDNGRKTIEGLSERVDVVLDRINSWERADREWQERTRKRLKIIWLIMSGIIFLMILLFISAQYAPDGLEEATVRFANESISKIRNMTAAGGGPDESSWAPGGNNTRRLQSMLNRTTDGSSDDRLLRAFDEL